MGRMAEPHRRASKQPRDPAPRPAAAREVRPSAPAPAVRQVTGPMFIDTSKGEFVDLRPQAPGLDRRAFEQEYARLNRTFEESRDNPGCVSCERCRHCTGSMFCKECEGCYRCTHCVHCKDSSHLTHCEGCDNCHGSAYCTRCQNCTGSSYLVLCRSCADCTYCFGCVGLSKKDFQILNVQYTKTEYFRIVKSLRAELGI